MKMKKRFLGILLSLVMALGLMPGTSLTAFAETEGVTGISLNKTSLSTILDTNSSGNILTATVTLSNAADKTVVWTCSDSTVVEARPNSNLGDGGYQNLCYLRTLKAGTATITVTATNGTPDTSDDHSATCTVTVYDPYPIGTVWKLGDTINLHGAWYRDPLGTAVYVYHSKDAEGKVPTGLQLIGSPVAELRDVIPVSEYMDESKTDGYPIIPYTDDRKGSLRLSIPEDKKGETPLGIKLASGKGTASNPYVFELAYESAAPAAPAKRHQAPPEGLTAKDASAEDAADGEIHGVTTRMHYSVNNGKSWRRVTEDPITGLTPGDYLVRMASTSLYYASEPVTVTVGYVAPAPTEAPTAAPTEAPTVAPTVAPTAVPTVAPTAAPTVAPTVAPTATPKPAKIKLSECKISVKDQTYTGKVLEPEVTVKYNGEILKEGTDYTVKYSHNRRVGTANVTLKGKGNYTGTVKKTFKINPKPVEKLTLKAGSKKLLVRWKKVSGVTGYQVVYGRTEDFSNAKRKSVKKARTVKITLKNLKAKKTYYVRIRSYQKVDGKTYYSKWSNTVKRKTKK